MKLSIVLPARNEEQLIKFTLSDIYTYLKKKKYSFEILVVVNGSEDSTEEIVKIYSMKYHQIKLIKSFPGFGYAFRKGLHEAKGDYIAIFNVDFYDLKFIDLIEIDLYGKDFIIGSKRAHWSQDSRSLSRKIVSLAFNLYLKIILGFIGSDTHGIKLFKRSVLNKVASKCKTYSGIVDTEFVIRSQRAGFKIADFPVIVGEKRSPRFVNRIIQTPIDVYYLTKALVTK